jgi:hypothetical protein
MKNKLSIYLLILLINSFINLLNIKELILLINISCYRCHMNV